MLPVNIMQIKMTKMFKYQNQIIIAGAIAVLFTAGLIGRSTKKCPQYENTVIIYEDSTRIDSLKRELSIRIDQIDSLENVVDNRQIEITKIKKRYEKTIDSINFIPDNELVDFFSNRYE